MNRYSEYGMFDGKPMILNSNREQRRRHLKENKNNKFATMCNYCKGKTESVTDDNSSFVCTLCGRIKSIKFDKEED